MVGPRLVKCWCDSLNVTCMYNGDLKYKEVYWGYFRCLVFGNSLTKHNKLGRFSYSVVIFPSRFPAYRLVIMLTLPISPV